MLYFCFDNEFIEQERENLSSTFELQYRRFISKHLTPVDVEENLEEFYYIFYISSELPSHMTNNLRIKFYEFKLDSESNQDDAQRVKIMERLISRLLHDLGMFYPEQTKNLSNEKQDRMISKRLLAKGAKCYQALADENERTIQRYKALMSKSG